MRIGTAAFFFVALLGGLLPTQSVRADLIAYWNFNGLVNNTNNGTSYLPDIGAGLIELDGWTSDGISAKMGSSINAIVPDLPGQGLGLERDDNNGASLVFSFDMSGFIDPILTFAERRNDFGFDSIQASWSTDGVTFVDFGAPFSPPTGSYGSRALDFSGVNALDGESTAFIRFTFDGATEGFGKIRLDNPQINAIAASSIPEPSFVMVQGAAVALLLAFGLRRTRFAKVDTV